MTSHYTCDNVLLHLSKSCFKNLSRIGHWPNTFHPTAQYIYTIINFTVHEKTNCTLTDRNGKTDTVLLSYATQFANKTNVFEVLHVL